MIGHRTAILTVAVVVALAAPAMAREACLTQTTVAQGGVSGFDADRLCDMDSATECGGADLVIADRDTWTKFWSIHTRNFTPPPSQPAVNFRTQFVLVSFLGERRTSSYSTEITCVEPASLDLLGTLRGLTASVRDVSPGSDCIVSPVISNPYHIVIVDRGMSITPVRPVAPRVSFEHEAVVVNCSGGTDELCRVCLPGDDGLGDVVFGEGLPCCP